MPKTAGSVPFVPRTWVLIFDFPVLFCREIKCGNQMRKTTGSVPFVPGTCVLLFDFVVHWLLPSYAMSGTDVAYGRGQSGSHCSA
eukprot:3625347-Rhodomonas_salina.2